MRPGWWYYKGCGCWLLLLMQPHGGNGEKESSYRSAVQDLKQGVRQEKVFSVMAQEG